MTWVIGMTGAPLGGLLVSDVRVTLTFPTGDTTYFDGLQKIHPLVRSMAGGFAGSVDVGFFLLGDFQKYVGSPGERWIARPGYLLHRWRRRARRLYAMVPGPLRSLGCELLFVAADADQGQNPLGFERSFAYIMSAPDFEVRHVPNREAQSIGSGSLVPEYCDVLKRSDEEWFALWKLDLEMGGMAHVAFAHGLSSAIEKRFERTVSEHLLVMRVRRGGFDMATNDREPISAGSPPPRKMPPLAREPRQLYGMLPRATLARGALALA